MKPKAYTALVLLLLTAVLLHTRGDADTIPAAQPLDRLPATLGTYTATDLPLDDRVLQVLGKGIFLNRVYTADPNQADRTPIGLFIGYFPTQRTGQAVHSPQNCLPGAGWTFDSSTITTLADATGKHYRVGEYLISNGVSRQEVLYWYRAHGRTVASDSMAKLYTLIDSIRYNRTDAALIRVITPLRDGETQPQAHTRAVAFAQRLTPLLPAYIPD